MLIEGPCPFGLTDQRSRYDNVSYQPCPRSRNPAHSGLSIAAGAFPLVRVLAGIGVSRSASAVTWGIFCLFDRRPKDPGSDVAGEVFSLEAEEAFRLRDDGVVVSAAARVGGWAVAGRAGVALGAAGG